MSAMPQQRDVWSVRVPRRVFPFRFRHWIGLSIVVAGALVVLSGLWQRLAVWPGVSMALALSGMGALGTALGVVPAMFLRAPSQRTHDALLGFGAGVMLAATSFSLIVPALSSAEQAGLSPWARSLGVAAALLCGAAVLMALERGLPHAHFLNGAGCPDTGRLRRVALFVLAIVLHNVPEGMAVGTAVVGADPAQALALAIGIAIQDVPEGLVVALALQSVGVNRSVALTVGALSGVVEPVAATLAVVAFGLMGAMLPWGLAFAAGAMLFVVSHEVIPESHRQGHERWATTGLLLGFVVMMMLDTAMG